ncbi:hypothetical protein ACF06W_24010 [Streptomyces albus]|uniref:hypothetical protein n=1 Tax=Streptomyces albus TaxID=1888 RepID=UPI0036F96578
MRAHPLATAHLLAADGLLPDGGQVRFRIRRGVLSAVSRETDGALTLDFPIARERTLLNGGAVTVRDTVPHAPLQGGATPRAGNRGRGQAGGVGSQSTFPASSE